jgi:LysM repeat protein
VALALALVAGGLMFWWLAAEAWTASSALLARGLRGTNDLPELVAIPLVWVGAAVAAWYALTSLAGLALRVTAHASSRHTRGARADVGDRPHGARLARFIGRFGAPAFRRVALTGVTAGLSVSMAILPASAVGATSDEDDADRSRSLVAPPLRESDLPGIPALPGFELTGHRSLIDVRIADGVEGEGGAGRSGTGGADATGPDGSDSADRAGRPDAGGVGAAGASTGGPDGGTPAPQDHDSAPRAHDPAPEDQQASSQSPARPSSPADPQGTQGTQGTQDDPAAPDPERPDPVFSDPWAPARSTPAPTTPPTGTDPAHGSPETARSPQGAPTPGAPHDQPATGGPSSSPTDASSSNAATPGSASTGTPPAVDPSATYVVAPGDSLWEIAAAHADPGAVPADIAAAWPQWYAANRDVIGLDPDLVLPGTVLAIPEPAATSNPGGTR